MPGKNKYHKDSSPKVIVGMPVFNGDVFLVSAIESILNQSYANIELYISDNASTDKTQEICEDLKNKDPRIQYFRQEKNIGVLKNYEFVLDRAGDHYFMWACADDIWDWNWVESLLPNALDGKTFSFGRFRIINKAADPILSLGEKIPVQYSGFRYFRRAKFFITPGILGKGNVMYSIFLAKNFDRNWLQAEEVSNYGGDTALMYQILEFYELKITNNAYMSKRLHGKNVGGSDFPGWKKDRPWVLNYIRMIMKQPLIKNYWPLSNSFEKLLIIIFYLIAVLGILASGVVNKILCKRKF